MLAVWAFSVLQPSYAQNLVPNPSFETIDTCPTYAGAIREAPPWFEPVNRSTDLFHDCGTPFQWSTGFNIRGHQDPDTGSAYAGIRCFAHWGVNYREYLSVKLVDTLKAGVNYNVGFKINLADGNSVKYATDEIGIFFTNDDPCNVTILNQNPQFSNPTGQYLEDMDNWMEVKGCYRANGTEAYLTLGNFNDDNNTNLKFVGSIWAQTVFYYVDDVYVEEITENPVDLGADTLLCDGQSITLSDDLENATYLWSTGSTSSSVSISDSQNVSVIVAQNSCSFFDTVHVDFRAVPVVDLGTDTSLCPGDSLTLDATIPAGSYLWSDNSMDSTLTITAEGLYGVTSSDSLCSVSDQISIDYIDPPQISLGPDTLLCEGTDYEIRATWEFSNYTWQDGSSGDVFIVTEAGDYYVTTTNQCGVDQDTITVSYLPHSDIDIPNVITPNGDGVNDRFIITNVETCVWKLEVYSRWGQLIYSNDDYDNSWEPRDLKTGLYYYLLSGHEGEVNNKGWIQVIR